MIVNEGDFLWVRKKYGNVTMDLAGTVKVTDLIYTVHEKTVAYIGGTVLPDFEIIEHARERGAQHRDNISYIIDPIELPE